jgi:hypothetical protein
MRMKEKILPYKCRCGGTLKVSKCPVEFYGIDFGIKECEVCTKCGAEFLGDNVIGDIEAEIKKMGIFGLEEKVQLTKSGNSLVIRIPRNIAEFAGLKYKDFLRIFPVEKGRIEIKVAS